MVSLDTNALIAACQGTAWKISGWPENIAIHHAKGCACCHEYINHLLRAQSLGQISDLHVQIDELKDTLQDVKKSYCNAEAALTKEHSHVKDLEQELKDLKSHLQSEANTSMLPPTTLVTVEPKLQVVIPTWSLPQPEAGPSQLPPPQPEAGPSRLPSS